MICSTSGFTVLHYLPEFTQTHVHWVSDAIQPSYPVAPFSSCTRVQSFPAPGSFPMNWLFAPGGQSIGAPVSASVLPTNIQYSMLPSPYYSDHASIYCTGVYINLDAKVYKNSIAAHSPTPLPHTLWTRIMTEKKTHWDFCDCIVTIAITKYPDSKFQI